MRRIKDRHRIDRRWFKPGTFILEGDIALDCLSDLDSCFMSSTRYDLPTHRVYFGRRSVTVYDIPDDRKEWFLRTTMKKFFRYMKEEPWDLNARVYSWLDDGRSFILKDYMALHYYGLNYIVSPFFFETGATYEDFRFSPL